MNPIPTHIAIIMDGNGRWAKDRGLPRLEGHRKGVEATEEVIEACHDLGVKHLTLYAFSDENWGRPQEEIDSLMQLLAIYVEEKCGKMLDKGIRFKTIGDIDRLPDFVLGKINAVKEKTADGRNMDLILALSYGSHGEICRAFKKCCAQGKKEVTPEDIDLCMDTAGIPNPDLLIRTSGELRLSNFMLWQLAYSELYFTDVLWPEFNEGELKKAVDNYCKRERRYGRVEG